MHQCTTTIRLLFLRQLRWAGSTNDSLIARLLRDIPKRQSREKPFTWSDRTRAVVILALRQAAGILYQRALDILHGWGISRDEPIVWAQRPEVKNHLYALAAA